MWITRWLRRSYLYGGLSVSPPRYILHICYLDELGVEIRPSSRTLARPLLWSGGVGGGKLPSPFTLSSQLEQFNFPGLNPIPLLLEPPSSVRRFSSHLLSQLLSRRRRLLPRTSRPSWPSRPSSFPSVMTSRMLWPALNISS